MTGNSGKADEELQTILNRRSRHLEDWEEALGREQVTDQEKVPSSGCEAHNRTRHDLEIRDNVPNKLG